MPWSWDEVGQRWDRAVEATRVIESPEPRARLDGWGRLSPFRPTMPIVFTGMRGSGKSVLYRALAGELVAGDSLPSKSTKAEKNRIMVRNGSRKIRTAMTVLPGQTSQEQAGSNNVHFGEGRTTRGVVHVVCWGHNKVWEAENRALIKSHLSSSADGFNLTTLLRSNLETELDDFQRVREQLTDTWMHRQDMWLIIAVTKCDLFWPRIDQARQYYIPSSEAGPNEEDTAPFIWELRSLMSDLGRLNIRNLAVLPVCSRPEDYSFDPAIETVEASLRPDHADVLINTFRNVVGEFCGG